jgi:hypothetical protein
MVLSDGSALQHRLSAWIKNEDRKSSMELAQLVGAHLFFGADRLIVLVN